MDLHSSLCLIFWILRYFLVVNSLKLSMNFVRCLPLLFIPQICHKTAAFLFQWLQLSPSDDFEQGSSVSSHFQNVCIFCPSVHDMFTILQVNHSLLLPVFSLFLESMSSIRIHRPTKSGSHDFRLLILYLLKCTVNFEFKDGRSLIFISNSEW